MEKKQILNIMVDLETASTKENAAILSWAMVAFMPDGIECDVKPFYKAVSLTSCFMAGMDIDASTQKWWQEQNPEAKAVIMNDAAENILPVTHAAYCWLSALTEKYDLYMWCRGIDFDLPKMEWCFRKFLELEPPYKYSHKMDVRSVLKFMQIDQSQFPFGGVKHHSVDDCLHDIKMVWEAFRMKEELDKTYMTVSAQNTSEDIKARWSDEEAEKEGFLELKEIGELFGHYFAVGSSVIFYRNDLRRIDDYIHSLKSSLEDVQKKAGMLLCQLEEQQAKG